MKECLFLYDYYIVLKTNMDFLLFLHFIVNDYQNHQVSEWR